MYIYINSKMFYEIILFSEMKSHVTVYMDMPCFLFENALLLLLLLFWHILLA